MPPLKRSTTPIRKRRAGKPRRGRRLDPAYKAWIAGHYCWVGEHVTGSEQCGPFPIDTEVAHVGRRGLGQKCDDRETMPLCAHHHRTGPASAHVLGRRFWDYHGIDRDAIIAELNRRYEEERWQ